MIEEESLEGKALDFKKRFVVDVFLRRLDTCGTWRFKMKKYLLALLAPLCLSGTQLQLLPPFYQSSKEIKAILDEPTLPEILGNYAVEVIGKWEKGYYVETVQGRLYIEVIPVKKGIGPAGFELKFLGNLDRMDAYEN